MHGMELEEGDSMVIQINARINESEDETVHSDAGMLTPIASPSWPLRRDYGAQSPHGYVLFFDSYAL